jgi:hypothetical protein
VRSSSATTSRIRRPKTRAPEFDQTRPSVRCANRERVRAEHACSTTGANNYEQRAAGQTSPSVGGTGPGDRDDDGGQRLHGGRFQRGFNAGTPLACEAGGRIRCRVCAEPGDGGHGEGHPVCSVVESGRGSVSSHRWYWVSCWDAEVMNVVGLVGLRVATLERIGRAWGRCRPR